MKCVCCGEDNIKFLTVEHDKRKIGMLSGNDFLRRLKKRGFSDNPPFQIFCFNCFKGRQQNKGICPHKIKQ